FKNVLRNSILHYGDNIAVSMVGGKPFTYEKFGSKVEILSKILQKRGIAKADKVAILSENKPQWGIAYFAITTLGAIAVPILPDFHANEIRHILIHSEAKAIFISQDQYNKLEDVEMGSLSTIFHIDDFSIIPPNTTVDKLKELIKEGEVEFAKLRESAMKLLYPAQSSLKEDDVASIIYTSGTTGHSKGVELTHKNLIFDAEATLKIQNVVEEDRLLSILPLSHSYEFTIGFLIPFIRGASIYYIDKPPVARVLLPVLQKIKPTMMLTVPLVIEKIYKLRIAPQLSKSGLIRLLMKVPAVRKKLHKVAAKKVMKFFGGEMKFFGIGGAGLNSEVEKFLREGKFPYAIGYGLTETSPLIAGSGVKNTRFRSTGIIIPEVEVKINKPDKKTGEGEIWVKGDNVMKGYYKDPDRTNEIFTEDGWLKTGDLGYMDKDEYLFIIGRLKNVIVGPSGENIYPEEIESQLNQYDDVLESLVYQDNGQLVVRVHLNYEELDKEFKHKKMTETQIAKRIEEILEKMRNEVNSNMSSFSRILKMIEQPDPFEKTPTKKIKRYLYTN
ncbi:MAG: AMP-binding protein, partial [Candidatus Celaenobacter antarcticus]|nr:AMP-binding protein [Candidatus Celaenobacter antarcticus]